MFHSTFALWRVQKVGSLKWWIWRAVWGWSGGQEAKSAGSLGVKHSRKSKRQKQSKPRHDEMFKKCMRPRHQAHGGANPKCETNWKHSRTFCAPMFKMCTWLRREAHLQFKSAVWHKMIQGTPGRITIKERKPCKQTVWYMMILHDWKTLNHLHTSWHSQHNAIEVFTCPHNLLQHITTYYNILQHHTISYNDIGGLKWEDRWKT